MLERRVGRALLHMEHLTLNDDDQLVVDGQLREPLMTAAQVAVLLAVPRSSVYDYARRHHQPLASVRIGRHRRFLRSELLAWLTDLARH
jgi:excisionase family DNA binding protein